MDQLVTLVPTNILHWLAVFVTIAPAVVTIASAIANLTTTTKDDEYVNKAHEVLDKVVNFLALNFKVTSIK